MLWFPWEDLCVIYIYTNYHLHKLLFIYWSFNHKRDMFNCVNKERFCIEILPCTSWFHLAHYQPPFLQLAVTKLVNFPFSTNPSICPPPGHSLRKGRICNWQRIYRITLCLIFAVASKKSLARPATVNAQCHLWNGFPCGWDYGS